MYEPLRLSRDSDAPPEERAPIFYIDDVEYTAPVRFSAAFALRYVDVVTKRGLDAATAWLLANGLSVGGYEALMEYEELTPTQLGSVVEHLQKMVVGAMDSGPKGKLKSA